MNSTPDPLLTEVERFLSETGMEPTYFGIKALNDSRFVFDLRKGRECRRATRERAESFMRLTRGAAAE